MKHLTKIETTLMVFCCLTAFGLAFAMYSIKLYTISILFNIVGFIAAGILCAEHNSMKNEDKKDGNETQEGELR